MFSERKIHQGRCHWFRQRLRTLCSGNGGNGGRHTDLSDLFPLSWPLYLLSALALTFLAIYVSQEAEKIFRKKDAPQIVIDEITGFLWTMFLVTPSVLHVMLGFIFFRVFDIIKPFPARLFQNRLPGGYGIVLDDVVAGIYANLLLLILVKLWGI